MLTMSKILIELITLLTVARLILIELQAIRKMLGKRMPGLVFLKVVREEDEMLFFNLVLPPVSAADVVKRQVIVTIGTGEPQTIDLVGTDLSTPELSGSDNDAVVGTLVDTDDAGNASPAREFSFVLVDTLAPPQPGELGIAITREE